ncbi:MAG: bifunctional diaminohydroxyphosphoribosylaminopyrimidine deaminase/5-amino-6-(5-phosphoribosylamino)uracil reductase RibD [Candidatus Brocadiaceae bacterium]|nr:bifunctional diaminohydroxyphosphoribosylaminopyrimidine deaminase/5-amino-6-(5-phosphoribosylamino)uracil reductase RibD [Candidatus Brocadiaceae bacterium]
MDFSDDDRSAMRRALHLAERGRGWVEPNPLVGAVLVREGRAVGEGWHERFGGPHAEVNALAAAGERARGSTLYVTLEPCDHAGKTPACAPAVVRAGVARVVIPLRDPTAADPGGGVAILRRAGIAVDEGLCEDEAARQNAAFFKLAAVGRPLVTAKWAMSIDGRAAARTGDSRWISSVESRRDVHRLRGLVDCVLVGAGTARADDPLLTCRDAERRRTAARLVLCGRRAPRPDSRLACTAREAPVLLACVDGEPPEGLPALQALGCEVLSLPRGGPGSPRVDPAALLDALGARRMANVLVEGGPDVLGSFFDAKLVDRVLAYVAPRLIGGSGALGPVGGQGVDAMSAVRDLADCEVVRVGPDVLVRGWVTAPRNWIARGQQKGTPPGSSGC